MLECWRVLLTVPLAGSKDFFIDSLTSQMSIEPAYRNDLIHTQLTCLQPLLDSVLYREILIE